MGRIIAVANHKGGVGKTTSVAAIGSILSEWGLKTLLIDLDAQANLTTSFMAEEPEETIYNALRGEIALPVTHIRENLDLVASSLDMAGVELDLSSKISREFILRKLLKPVADKYEYILLDCPPSLGLVTIDALTAAKEVYIPLTAEALPSKGLTKLTNIIQMVRENLNEGIALSGVIITRWERTNLSKMVEEQLRSVFGDTIFKTKIRKNVAIAEAPLYSKDVVSYAPESNGAKDYRALAEEIVEQTTKEGCIIFSKEFSEGNGYSLGEFTGEPNEDGEQDYRGYSVTPTSLDIIGEGEDFLAEDEVENLRKDGTVGLQRRKRATLIHMEKLYKDTRAKLNSLGYPEQNSLSMDEVEDMEEPVRAEAKDILEDAIAKAMKIVVK